MAQYPGEIRGFTEDRGGLPDNKTIKIPHSEDMQLLLLQEKTQINITVKNHLIL